MNRTGQAVAESFALHVLLAGFVIALFGLFPSHPPIIPLDFSLVERSGEPVPNEEVAQKVESITPSVPAPPTERQPTPVLKAQRKTVANATSAKVRPQLVQKPTEAGKETTVESLAQIGAAPTETTETQGASQSVTDGASGVGTVEAYRRANFSAIRSAILANLRYPMMARRHGWGGKVEVAFLITPAGGVRELRIQASSGHEVLDEEAMAAIRRSAPFTPPRIAALLVMPVTFELN